MTDKYTVDDATPAVGGEAAAELVQRFETESMALHKTQREWLVREISKALAAPPASPLRGREIVALIPRLLERADSYIRDNGRDDAYSCNLINDLASILRRVSESPPEQPAAEPDKER